MSTNFIDFKSLYVFPSTTLFVSAEFFKNVISALHIINIEEKRKIMGSFKMKINALKVFANLKLSWPWKTTKAICLGFSPSKAEWRWSPSLAFGISGASEASVHKLTKAHGCFEGSEQNILSKLPHEKFQMRAFGWGNCHPQTWQKWIVQ